MKDALSRETDRTKASRWFVAWIVAWVVFIAVLLTTARIEELDAMSVGAFLAMHGALLAFAVYLAAGLRHGKRVGGAAVLVGFFTLMGAGPAIAAAAGGLQHEHPTLLVIANLLFVAVTVRTFLALIVLLRRTHGEEGPADSEAGGPPLPEA